MPQQFPNEILFTIFNHTYDFTPAIKLPLVTSDYPWVLGRVCSSWREVSRSIPRLWRVTISFDVNSDPGSDHAVSSRDLAYAIDILPKGTYLGINTVRKSEKNPPLIPTDKIIPHLQHVTELRWYIKHVLTSCKHQSYLPKHSLAYIEVLSMKADRYAEERGIDSDNDAKDHFGHTHVDLFGKSPRLRELSLDSTIPDFLYWNIPWSQLRSLTLSAEVDNTPFEVIDPSWNEFAFRNPSPISSLTSLEELTLASYFLDILLDFPWPWKQLMALKIRDTYNPMESFPLIVDVLPLCVSLLTLNIGPLWSPDQCIMPCETLTSLTVRTIPLNDVYTIALQCPLLEALELEYTTMDEPPELDGNDPIVLSRLTDLHLSLPDIQNPDDNWSPRSFPVRLVLPSLTSLKLDGSLIPFPGHAVASLITQSNACLKSFSIQRDDHSVEALDPGPLHALFSVLHTCTAVHVKNLVFPEPILDAVASGLVLPGVKELSFGAMTRDRVVSVIKQRSELKYERSEGSSCVTTTLQSVVGYVPIANLGPDGLNSLLEVHGVKCSWVGVDLML
ncbi:hypothetical protein H0H93_015285 [Arthromyces matolae]|nr:hypothetical protein H0H93_015285 [Arthromyces matolae]